MNLYHWAMRWGIDPAAIAELRRALCEEHTIVSVDMTKSESATSKMVRLSHARAGGMLWRNNVGALLDDRGVPVRYGLANESKQMNKQIKSSDLIGISPEGQFVAREVKKPGWQYTGNDHEKAQLKFLELVTMMGGDAAFTTGE